MVCNTPYDDCFVAGDTYRFVAVLKDSDNNPLDLTDYDVVMQLRTSLKNESVALQKLKTIDATEGVEGLILLELTPADTLGLNSTKDVITYVYDVELTDPTDTEVQTIVGGTFSVHLGVTR